MTKVQFKVMAGIDTHHVVLITDYGKNLCDRKFLAVGSGYREIAAYLTSFGPVTAVGVEGTGSYGAELARVLAGHGFTVREVNRANRAERCLHGKSDLLDAYQAAEAVLAERGASTPKSREGFVEALRVISTARTALLYQISGALTAAPEQVRAKYRGMASDARVKAMAASRPAGNLADPTVATLMTLKRLGARHRFLSEEIAEIDAELAFIVATHAPELFGGQRGRCCRGLPAAGDLRGQPRTDGR
ncbi:IS110 family transposase [Arthrobacter psychrochitiniphilus]|uniref:IS110 family transposase n=1 Tax=Arthrobacter psychrochitiniphilus TaxID=291045 RepID=UPI003F7C1DAB